MWTMRLRSSRNGSIASWTRSASNLKGRTQRIARCLRHCSESNVARKCAVECRLDERDHGRFRPGVGGGQSPSHFCRRHVGRGRSPHRSGLYLQRCSHSTCLATAITAEQPTMGRMRQSPDTYCRTLRVTARQSEAAHSRTLLPQLARYGSVPSPQTGPLSHRQWRERPPGDHPRQVGVRGHLAAKRGGR